MGEHGESHGTATLYIDDEIVAKDTIRTQTGHFSLCGEGMCIGYDSGDAISEEYTPRFPLTGATIGKVQVHVGDDIYFDVERELAAAMARDELMLGPGFSHKHMVHIEGGVLQQGSEDFYPEERPVRRVAVEGFWMDRHPVTNAEFRRFVVDTGHVTVAELAPDPAGLPGRRAGRAGSGLVGLHADPGPRAAGRLDALVALGPGSVVATSRRAREHAQRAERHPVVHIAHEDATAYAAWADKRLASEEEWEHAARGGLVGATYPWGDEYMPRSRVMANNWHGDFPWRVERPGRYGRTTPVGTFPPNGYGLVDVVGNVWEWTSSRWTVSHAPEDAVEHVHHCCGPQVVGEQTRMVMKGGSYVCAPSYCHRYRPAARQGQAARSTTSHLGFRCAHSL
ncbi:formylglycine-generating enzyme family protein [Aeromicrobium sp. UC242_57]|uniref:formylglycine-generating enzyme family protein n=1 Tax=Aeromicrobium sp. UC242_57 TaxID=3374624 RepID=UPI0037882C16